VGRGRGARGQEKFAADWPCMQMQHLQLFEPLFSLSVPSQGVFQLLHLAFEMLKSFKPQVSPSFEKRGRYLVFEKLNGTT